MTYNPELVSFVETRLFSSLIATYLTDDQYGDLQRVLIANPCAGAVIRGSGGVRKLRWRLAGRGARGGLRIIYYLRRQQGEIWMLTLYAKNVEENIPGHVLAKIREEIDDAR